MKLFRFMEAMLPLAFWLLMIFAFDTPELAVMTLCAAVIHELGHILLGARRGLIRLLPAAMPNGLRISPRRTLSYKDELALAAAGPLFGFMAAALAAIAARFFRHADYFLTFSELNLLTSLGNLLPVRGYDGYRILECACLMRARDHARALRILAAISYGLTAAGTFGALYLILKLGEGYWIFGIFFHRSSAG